MITVEEAKEILKNTALLLGSVNKSCEAALGYVLSEDIYSPIDMPGVNQSAMDGYALNYSESIENYKVIGEVAAGDSQNPVLKEGEAVRIFTGARVPDSANVVAQQEIVDRKEESIRLTKEVFVGKNIRLKGEQIKTGERALTKGTQLSPGGIGFLTGLGITEVAVYQKPKIALLTTGNELVLPGSELQPGQIFESNSYMLLAALESHGFVNVQHIRVKDDYSETKNKIALALADVDALILTGGISVGDYDFVGKALNELGVKELFYKIKQKPGKPLFMGTKEQKLIAALPGNPASALTCFYVYVLPCLRAMMGKGYLELPNSKHPVLEDIKPNGQRAEFLKAFVDETGVKPLGQQSSAMLQSFALANCFIYLPLGVNHVNKGEEVTVITIG
jgi:molybdopterin molybdotransferase